MDVGEEKLIERIFQKTDEHQKEILEVTRQYSASIHTVANAMDRINKLEKSLEDKDKNWYWSKLYPLFLIVLPFACVLVLMLLFYLTADKICEFNYESIKIIGSCN